MIEQWKLTCLLKLFGNAILHLTFPTKCLHCGSLLDPEVPHLCPSCSHLLESLDAEGRCSMCFHLQPTHQAICLRCRKTSSPFVKVGAVFVHEGPARSLVHSLKVGRLNYLVKGMAALLAAQLIKLDWPIPDALIPVPISGGRIFSRGFNQSVLLAGEMGRLLQIPVWPVLQRKWGAFSQSSLSTEGRNSLKPSQFKLSSSSSINGKTLLIIDDVAVTGATLRACGEVLSDGGAAHLYGLTFSRFLDD